LKSNSLFWISDYFKHDQYGADFINYEIKIAQKSVEPASLHQKAFEKDLENS